MLRHLGVLILAAGIGAGPVDAQRSTDISIFAGMLNPYCAAGLGNWNAGPMIGVGLHREISSPDADASGISLGGRLSYARLSSDQIQSSGRVWFWGQPHTESYADNSDTHIIEVSGGVDFRLATPTARLRPIVSLSSGLFVLQIGDRVTNVGHPTEPHETFRIDGQNDIRPFVSPRFGFELLLIEGYSLRAETGVAFMPGKGYLTSPLSVSFKF
ncbi:hypothetical protein BH23BAC4_BH23BAC4_09020 [soil metagenome]